MGLVNTFELQFVPARLHIMLRFFSSGYVNTNTVTASLLPGPFARFHLSASSRVLEHMVRKARMLRHGRRESRMDAYDLQSPE